MVLLINGGTLLPGKKLWIIFVALLFFNGCERKENTPSATPVSASSTENQISDEKLVDIGVIYSVPADIIMSRLTIIREFPQNNKIVYVDSNVRELHFLKIAIEKIEGLEQLQFLDTIVFNLVSSLTDLSFLADAPQLKRLFIESSSHILDWNFVESLPNLEVLYVASNRPPKIEVDFKNNNYLEYIRFSHAGLETFPEFRNIPASLRYLVLEGNRIRTLPNDFNVSDSTTVFLGLNQFIVTVDTPTNINTEPSFRVILEIKYLLPDIPSDVISDLDL